jgi:MFS family permease
MAFMQSAYAIGWACSTLCYFVVFSTLPQQVAWRIMFVVGILPALSVLVIRRKVKDRFPPENRQSVWRSFGTLWQGSQRGAHAPCSWSAATASTTHWSPSSRCTCEPCAGSR